MQKCKHCQNDLVLMPVKRKVYLGIGRYAMRPDGHKLVCTYCNWKGRAGAGKALKEAIQTL